VTSAPKEPQRPILAVVATSVCLLAVAILGFAAYLFGISSIQEHRTQDTLYASFRPQLEAATAPVAGPIATGKPIGILAIPAIRVRQVVVEGTTSGQLMRGPGHRRNTVLPGQPGASVIMGRRGTFGAPFAKINKLQIGDVATVTTGQGTSKYRVADVRTSDQQSRPLIGTNRLVLVTADSPFRPSHYVIVTMIMDGKPYPAGGTAVPISTSEVALAGDTAAALPLVLWGQLLLVTIAVSVWAYHRFGRWPAYLGTAVILLAVLWNVWESLARLLPNVQ
jgi:sortase A